MFSDTPFPPEEPTGDNPPDGAILDYYLPDDARSVSIEILWGSDPSTTRLIRRFSSNDAPVSIDSTLLPHPTYWIRSQQELGTDAGHNRFIWDLRYAPPIGTQRQFSIAAVQYQTPDGPHGPFVHPESYRVRLTADGFVSEQVISVRLDPRVEIADGALALQTEYSLRAYDSYNRLQEIRDNIDRQLAGVSITGRKRAGLQALRGRGMPGDPDILYGSIYQEFDEAESIVDLQHKLLFMLNVLQSSDAKPTAQAMEAIEALERTEEVLRKRWVETSN
jgi:hypothetical protein